MKPCPIAGCQTRIPTARLTCHRHWFMVSKHTRDRVWLEYRREENSPAHLAACADAIAEVLEKVRG